MESATPPRSQRAEGLAVALLFCGLAIATVLVGSRPWLPALVSRHGVDIDRMLVYLLLATGLLFLVGHFVLGYFIWRSSKSRRVSSRLAGPKVERNWSIVLGLTMTLVAEGGVLAIGMPVWNEYFIAPPPHDAVAVEVTGEQFAWTVRYPGPDGVYGRINPSLITDLDTLGRDPDDPAGADDIVGLNNLYLPVNRPVLVQLRAKDVIHSFFLPQFRVKQDAVPGMKIDVWFVPTETGDYELACTELCGLGHYQMKGSVHVLSAADFGEWMNEKTNGQES